jgi:uncharacterized protein YbjT (DUF2867 family)
VVLHNEEKAPEWQRQGAQTAVADVHNSAALHRLFKQGERLFLLNPPAPPVTDTAVEERRTLAAILKALDGSGLRKIVAASAYGAQPGERLGDLGVLYDMEQALAAQPIPATIIRAAYYLSNWDFGLATAQQEGKIHTLFPPNFKLPMVAPHDIGLLAARLMLEPATQPGLHYIEGPAHYSPAEVAAAFAAALHKPVQAVETPRPQWLPTLKAMGFSAKAAESFVNMTALTLESPELAQESPKKGATTLQQYVDELVRKSRAE